MSLTAECSPLSASERRAMHVGPCMCAGLARFASSLRHRWAARRAWRRSWVWENTKEVPALYCSLNIIPALYNQLTSCSICNDWDVVRASEAGIVTGVSTG